MISGQHKLYYTEDDVECHNILRVKAPVKVKPMRRRRKATRNWVPLPTVGRNGLPDAACQTSSSGESIWSRELGRRKENVGQFEAEAQALDINAL